MKKLITLIGAVLSLNSQAVTTEKNKILDESSLDRLSKIVCSLSPDKNPNLPEPLNTSGVLQIYKIQVGADGNSAYGKILLKIGTTVVSSNEAIEMSIARKLKCVNAPCGSDWSLISNRSEIGLQYFSFHSNSSRSSQPYLLKENDFIGSLLIKTDSNFANDNNYFGFDGNCTYELRNK